MSSNYFFVRLIPHRPDFPASMTADEQAVMEAHTGFLIEQQTAGVLVVAGPVMDPAGVFGMAVFEAESLERVQDLLSRDPARAIGRQEILPMASAVARPKRV